jgi:hypothetical protein
VSAQSLDQALLESSTFQQTLKRIAVASTLQDLSAIQSRPDLGSINWSYALRSASVLASGQSEAAQDAALRIAQACLNTKDDDGIQDGHRRAAALILERMGNRRTLALAEKRHLVESEAWKEVPSPLALDVIRRRLELSLPEADGGAFPGNQFQRDFWTAASSADWVSVSAPTSAGKSYIVKRWFEEQLSSQEEFRGIYLVPTRALIDEVSQSLMESFGSKVPVFTIPWDEEINKQPQEVYVFTQERLHFLQQRLPEFEATMLFVDEAQKFADGERGVLLQRVVAETVRRAPEGQVIFASPLSENPELLLEGAPATTVTEALRSETITVNQNLLWVDEVQEKAKTWSVDLIRNGAHLRLGEFELDGRPVNQMKRLSLVAVALGRHHEGNLVYVNFASEAETAAQQISEVRGKEVNLSEEPRIVALKELIKKTIEPRYRLIKALDAGVAFHYGNMPLLVRAEIEDLFRDGLLSYLVCTSTLMEGVNLPCSNLFVRGPKKGRETYMEPSDFWNLAGRAGRWGQEFQGNIICIDTRDPKKWPKPPISRVRQPLRRATDTVLKDLPALRSYVAGEEPEDPDDARDKLVEPVFSLLASRISKGEPLNSMAGASQLDLSELAGLEAQISQALEGVEVPPEIYRRHAGISPLGMQRLLEYFREHKNPESLPLALPETRESDKNYLAALTRARKYLGAPFSEHGGYLHSRAILIRDWMQGKALPVLISERIKFEEDRHPAKKADILVAAAIRDTMRDVEQFARFEAPKYLGCYADVLEYFLKTSDSDIEAPEMDLPMMLEMGVSRPSELAMMTLGLSRASAIALEKYVVPDAMSRDECIRWLSEQDLDALDVPALVREEIARLLGNLGVKSQEDAR